MQLGDNGRICVIHKPFEFLDSPERITDIGPEAAPKALEQCCLLFLEIVDFSRIAVGPGQELDPDDRVVVQEVLREIDVNPCDAFFLDYVGISLHQLAVFIEMVPLLAERQKSAAVSVGVLV